MWKQIRVLSCGHFRCDPEAVPWNEEDDKDPSIHVLYKKETVVVAHCSSQGYCLECSGKTGDFLYVVWRE